MKKIYDITLLIRPGMPVWPGDPQVELKRIQKMEEGAPCNVSYYSSAVHAGTHVDAPVHFIPGATTIETLPLDVLVGTAQVVQLPDDCGLITGDVVHSCGIEAGTLRVLFKTRSSKYWAQNLKEFQKDFVGISPDGAEALVSLGVKLVGVDYLSVAPFNQGGPTHQVLLGAGVIALEGLNLSEVAAGKYELYCLPLKLGGSDGAPARTILIEE